MKSAGKLIRIQIDIPEIRFSEDLTAQCASVCVVPINRTINIQFLLIARGSDDAKDGGVGTLK